MQPFRWPGVQHQPADPPDLWWLHALTLGASVVWAVSVALIALQLFAVVPWAIDGPARWACRRLGLAPPQWLQDALPLARDTAELCDRLMWGLWVPVEAAAWWALRRLGRAVLAVEDWIYRRR